MSWTTFIGKSLRNEGDRRSAQEVRVINFINLDIASPPKKRANTKRATKPGTIITRSAAKSSDGSYSQQHRKISTAKHSAAAAVIRKMTEEAKKTTEDTP